MRRRRIKKTTLTLIGTLLMGAASVFVEPAFAATPPASDVLMPKTSLAYVAAPSIDDVEAMYSHTKFNSMMQYDAFRAFRAEFDRWKKDVQGTALVEHIPASWEEIHDVAAGETAVALIPTKVAGRYATVLTIDVGSDPMIGETFLSKIDGRQKYYKRPPLKTTLAGARVVAYSVPAPKGTPAGESVAVLKDQLLILSNSVEATQGVLARATKPAGDSLADSPVYKLCQARSLSVHPDAAGHIKAFLVPVPLLSALEQMDADQAKRKYVKSSSLTLLEKHGFAGVDGIGGVVSISHNNFDLFYRGFVHIPNPTKGLKLLEFTPSNEHAPPAWAPANAATYASLSWNLATAFKNLAPVYDDLIGEGEPGAFADTIKSMKDDPDGPRVDIEKDVIAKLTGKVSLLADAPQAASSDRRMIMAFETKQEAELKALVNRLFKNDENFKRRVIGGYEVWESASTKDKTKPRSAICVGLGSLLSASHVEMLETLLKNPDAPKLIDDQVYQETAKLLQGVQGGPVGFTLNSRLRDEARSLYEAFRNGDPAKAGSFAGHVLNSVLTAKTKSGKPLDVKLLPDFSAIQDALGVNSAAGTIHNDGWLVTGFVAPAAE